MKSSFARPHARPLPPSAARRAAAITLTLAIGAGSAVGQTSTNAPVSGSAVKPLAASALAAELKWLQAEKITVSTASLRAESLERAPATVRVLTQRQIQERGYRNIEDVLKSLPGVDVLNHVHPESKSFIAMRGVTGNNKFVILQDGIRISSPTGETFLQVSENYPLYMARQVEILSGPASALYGADAMTGVINIITEEPTPQGTVRASFAGGDFSTIQSTFYASKRFSDDVAFTLSGHHQQSDGAPLSRLYRSEFTFAPQPIVFVNNPYGIPAGGEPYKPHYRSYSTYAKLELWENLTLGWNQSFLATSLADAELPGQTTVYDKGPENPSMQMTAYARYKFTLNERITGEVQVNYARYERLPHSGFRNAFTASTTLPFVQAFKYAFGNRLQIEPRLTLELEKHVLSAGLTADYSYSIPKTVDLATPYDTSKSPSQQGRTYLGTAFPARLFEETAYNAGAFVQAQTDWSERLSSTVGLRFDYNTVYGETVNPRLGLVFQQSAETTWKMLYGRSYLAPSAHLRFENFGSVGVPPAATFYFFIPNPDLKPEELQTLELSVSHQLTEGLTFGAVAFYTLMDQAILPVLTAGAANTTFIPGVTIDDTERYENIGEQHARGVEVTLEQTWKSDLSRLSLWGSFSFINGHLKQKSTRRHFDLPFTSTEMVKLGATFNHGDRLIISPSLNWNGPQAGYSLTSGGARTPGFHVLNLHAEVRSPDQNLAFFVRAENLLDQRYFNAGYGGDNFFYKTPQDSRFVSVGVRGAF